MPRKTNEKKMRRKMKRAAKLAQRAKEQQSVGGDGSSFSQPGQQFQFQPNLGMNPPKGWVAGPGGTEDKPGPSTLGLDPEAIASQMATPPPAPTMPRFPGSSNAPPMPNLIQQIMNLSRFMPPAPMGFPGNPSQQGTQQGMRPMLPGFGPPNMPGQQQGMPGSIPSKPKRTWASRLQSLDSDFPKGKVRSGTPPGTKIVRNKQPISIMKHHARGGHLVFEEVNSSIKECIEILSRAGEHVSLERVEAMILEKYQVRQFAHLNLQCRNMIHMPSALEHSRNLTKVNTYAHSFVRAHSLCTLYELGECMREFHKDKLEFEKLEVGPLQAMPVVFELFKFPMDEYIPEINSLDIMEHLHKYLSTTDAWSKSIELDDFLEYLVALYRLETPFSLGIRIQSISTCVQMLKKSKRDAARMRKMLLESFGKAFIGDVTSAISGFRDSLLQSGEAAGLELKLHYTNLHPVDAIKEIFEKFDILMNLMKNEGNASLRAKMRKFYTSFEIFKRTLESDRLCRQIFHLAICLSKTQAKHSIVEVLKETRMLTFHQFQAEVTRPKKPKPSQGAVVEKMIHYLNLCLQEGSLMLTHLKRIEEKVAEAFEFPTFDELGQGTFLYLLLSNSKIKLLLDDFGGARLGLMSSAADKFRYYHPTFSDLKELICQAKQAGVMQEPQVATIVCEQFNVKEVKILGQGSVTGLCEAANTPGNHDAPHYNCYFEAALCGKACISTQSTQSVGRLGNQSREKAMAVLTSCPLLEDMAAWSHWGLVFQPEHGNLKDFVARNGRRQTITILGGKCEAISDFMALETEPGKLLKISSQSTPDMFNEALNLDDPLLAAGHLASLVAGSNGVESSPLALLANHVKGKLLSIRAQQGVSLSMSWNEREDPKVVFIVAILMRLPIRMCAVVANQVLLDPLSQVVGSTKSKVAIMQVCQLPWQKERLECLGMMLGIPEWAESLQVKMEFPSYLVREIVVDEFFGDEKADEEEEEKEEEEESVEMSEMEVDDQIDRILSEDGQAAPQALSQEGTTEKDDDNSFDKKAEEEEAASSNAMRPRVAGTMEKDKVVDKDGEKSEAGSDEQKSEVTDKMAASKSVKMEVEEKAEEEGEGESGVFVSKEDVCHRVIDAIRREEFGEGIKLNEEASKLMKNQQERQGRSLKRLSRDLYSKDTHFVLELIQNADDNAYTNDTLPSLNFIIDALGVTIQNNELGFEEQNIRALCDVGKSTKSKHTLGYIGQKGIGFKSVFRVTDRPEIHSNGFRICFDVNSGPMGYIMPHWITEPIGDESWKTQIMLPWTDDIKDQIETHAARFNDIQPSLLLFLHRLREITIMNKVEGCEMKMSRRDLPTGEIQISHSHGLDRWLVVRKVLDATEVSVEVTSGVDVHSTEIALAFPLKDKSKTFKHGTRLGQLPVFAFLPLQSYGFRFIVQGDFNVPSSRESVDKDSCWNQWLRDRIPPLFIQAWDSFLNLPDMTPMDAFTSYLQFIPLEGEVMGFFSPITSAIRSQLMAKDCMPVVGVTGKKEDILWKAPSKTVMTRSPLVRDIIGPRLLLHNLGLYYLHWEVFESVDHGTLQALGVNTIGTDHLLQIGQGMLASWKGQGSRDQVVELAKWMACVYCSLDHFKGNRDVFNKLAKMRIIPLGDGSLVSMEDTTIFLLTSNDHRLDGDSNNPQFDPLKAIRQDVNIIHPSLTTTPDPEVNSQVTKLLNHMDIKQMTPHDLMHSHVLPVLRSDAWKRKSEEILVGYLVCAKQVLSESTVEMAHLKSVARVVTNQGVKQPTKDNIHFSVEFGNEVDLMRVFPMESWTLLHPAYLPPNASKAEIESWHQFFSLLGVQDFLCVNKTEVHLNKNTLLTSPWASYEEVWQNLPKEFVIEDFACEEFRSLISKSNLPFDTSCRLYELLEKDWDKDYKKFMVTKVKSKTGEEIWKEDVETSFAIQLKTHPWVPATFVTMIPDTRLLKDRNLMKANHVYCQNAEVEKLLAHTAKYLAVKTPSESPFTQFLQVKSSVEKEAVKEALISWGQRSKDNPDMPAVFSTSVDHMVEVYNFLQEAFPAGEIQKLFHEEPVIFIAPQDRVKGISNSSTVTGHMMYRKELWWRDTSGLFTKYRQSLEKYKDPLAKFHFMLPFYEGKEELFGIARIDPTHNMLHLAQLLKHITTIFTLSDEGVLHDILHLFSLIGQSLAKADEMQAGVRTQEAQVVLELKGKVKSLLLDCCIFPTKTMQLVCLKDEPMIADSKEWEKMFENKPRVPFLLLEPPRLPVRRLHSSQRLGSNLVDPDAIQTFLELFKEEIKPLSSCVMWEEITSGFKPCARGQKYLHNIVGVLQQFLYFSYPDVYQEFKKHNAHQLKDMIFTEVDRLEVKYELNHRSNAFEIKTENCIINGNHFYFLTRNIGNQSEINKEVARFFANNNEECAREIRSFLSQAVPILEGRSNESFQDLLSRQRKQIDNLPREEEVWEVPLPVIDEYPPVMPPVSAMMEDDPPHHGAREKMDRSESTGPKQWPPKRVPDSKKTDTDKPGAKKAPSKFTSPEVSDYLEESKKIPDNFRFEENETTQSKKDKKAGQRQSKGPGKFDSGYRVFESRQSYDSSKWSSTSVFTRGKQSAQDDDNTSGQRKRKLVSRLSCSDEDIGGQRPSSKRQWLESNEDKNASRRMLASDKEDTRGDGARPGFYKGDSNTGPRHHGNNAPSGVVCTQDRDSWRTYSARTLQFNIPVWDQKADSVAFTELTSDLSKITAPEDLGEKAKIQEIGKWGELLVYDYLKCQKNSNPTLEDIIWANGDGEKGLPYDFEMVFKTDDEKDTYSVFIEVKATRTDDRALFEISANQVEFALNAKERYQIFRVYGAGKDSMRLVRIDNIADRMKTKSVQLLMVI